MSASEEVENEVAFAALSGWNKAFAQALERYCEHCRSLDPREAQRRPNVLLDFNCWASPQGAAHGLPIGGMEVADAARFLAERVQRRKADPYALLGSIMRECEK